MLGTNAKQITERHRPTKTGSFAGLPWFHVSIATGLALAIVLLASSISTYLGGIPRIDRGSPARQSPVPSRDDGRTAQRDSVQTRDQLSAVLQGALERAHGRIAWILVENHEGEVLSLIGPPATPVFSTVDIRSHIESRRSIFKTISTASGQCSSRLSFMLPHGPLRSSLGAAGGALGHPITTVEIAEPWRAANVALWSVRRHLMINASAALMLLLSVTIIARRFRSYVAGQGLEQTIEVARTVQRDLLPSAQCELDDFEVAGDCAPLAQVGRRCL